jgi:hypothetical protein
VAGQQEIEWLDLVGILLSRIEAFQRSHDGGTVTVMRPTAGRFAKLNSAARRPSARRMIDSQTCAIHSRSSLSGSRRVQASNFRPVNLFAIVER